MAFETIRKTALVEAQTSTARRVWVYIDGVQWVVREEVGKIRSHERLQSHYQELEVKGHDTA